MHGEVIETAQLTPSLVRVVLGGEGMAEFTPAPYTDQYVNALFVPDGAPYETPFDLDAARAGPAELRPRDGATRSAGGTPTRGPSPSTSWSTATRATPGGGLPEPNPVTCCSSSDRVAATRPIPTPTGTSWSVTRARSRRSPRRSSRSGRAPRGGRARRGRAGRRAPRRVAGRPVDPLGPPHALR